MKRIAYIAGAAVFALAGSAMAGGYDQPLTPPPSTNGFYIGGLVGPAVLGGSGSDLVDTGYNVGGQLGYRFDNFRVEAEASYISHSVLGLADFNVFTLMANGYYDINFGSKFVPYVGAGIGWARFTSNVVSSADNEFAYQGIVGANYNITNNFAIGANYHIVSWTNNNGLYENRFNATLNYYFS